MVLSKKEKEEALNLCLNFKKNKHTKTVYLNITKKIFLSTLINLIKSDGVALYQSKNTCGITAVMHLSSSNDIVMFTKFAINLYENGEGELNEYVIEKKNNVALWAKTAKSKGNFNGVSLVVIGAIRFVENSSLRFIQETMDGMTWPKEVRSISNKILCKDLIIQNSFLLGWRIKKIKIKLEGRSQIILLYRTSSWKENGKPFKDAWHYIVLKGISRENRENIILKYWDYGVEKEKNLTFSQFYKGIVKTFVFFSYKD